MGWAVGRGVIPVPAGLDRRRGVPCACGRAWVRSERASWQWRRGGMGSSELLPNLRQLAALPHTRDLAVAYTLSGTGM